MNDDNVLEIVLEADVEQLLKMLRMLEHDPNNDQKNIAMTLKQFVYGIEHPFNIHEHIEKLYYDVHPSHITTKVSNLVIPREEYWQELDYRCAIARNLLLKHLNDRPQLIIAR